MTYENPDVEARWLRLQERAARTPSTVVCSSPARAARPVIDDEVQVVNYTEHELELLEAHRQSLMRLRELRVLESSQRARILSPPPTPAEPSVIVQPEPEPGDDAPPTMRSAGCDPSYQQDLHEPFLLTRVRVPGARRSRVPPSPPDTAPRRPTAPRQRASGPPWPTRLGRLAKRLLGGKEAQQSASAFSPQPGTELPQRARPPVRGGPKAERAPSS